MNSEPSRPTHVHSEIADTRRHLFVCVLNSGLKLLFGRLFTARLSKSTRGGGFVDRELGTTHGLMHHAPVIRDDKPPRDNPTNLRLLSIIDSVLAVDVVSRSTLARMAFKMRTRRSEFLFCFAPLATPTGTLLFPLKLVLVTAPRCSFHL
jgi:hypothetical protein